MHRVRVHLSYANAVATVALFLALGGGAYAATQLPRESVGTPQLKAEAVTPAKLSDAARKGMKGTRGERGAMGPQGATGPQGALGPQGPTGAQGPSGPSDAYAVTGSGSNLSFSGAVHKILSLTLPAGSYVVTAKQSLTANANSLPDEYRCFLNVGGTDVDISRATLAGRDLPVGVVLDRPRATLLTSAAVTLTGPTEVADYCAGPNEYEILGRSAVLTAIRVGSLH